MSKVYSVECWLEYFGTVDIEADSREEAERIAAGLVVLNRFLPEEPREEIIDEGLEVIVTEEQDIKDYKEFDYPFFTKEDIDDKVIEFGTEYVEAHDKKQAFNNKITGDLAVKEYISKQKKEKE